MTVPKVAIPAVSTFFERCFNLIARPEWLDALSSSVSTLAKGAETGDVVILAVDPGGDSKLAGYVVASGGRLVYEFLSDVTPEDEKAFWLFASANYIWLTPTMALRKDIAARVGGKADGQSFRLDSDAIAPSAFINALTASLAEKPERPSKRAREKEAVLPEVVNELPLAGAPEVALPIIVAYPDRGETVSPQDGGVTLRSTAELQLGETMAMF